MARLLCYIVLAAAALSAPAEELQLLEGEPGAGAALEVGLLLFDDGVESDTEDNRREGIFPEIRAAEAAYFPYALRRTLVDSNHWGAVRVMPGASSSSELLITGTIVHSDGETLELQLVARDARGIVWFDQLFSGTAAEDAYQPHQRRQRRPFQHLYNEVANALLQHREGLEEKSLREIRQVAGLRYAGDLAPSAFDRYLARDIDGIYRVQGLPSMEDPMVQRIQRVREQEYLFIDTTDEEYAALYTEMTPVYDLWRQFQREQFQYRDAYEERLADRDKPRKGSYQALKQTYYNYRWEKIQRQEMKLLAKGFNNEVAPTSVEVEGRVFKLAGSLEERYREWRSILGRIYDLETGF